MNSTDNNPNFKFIDENYQEVPFPHVHPNFGQGKYQKRWNLPNGYILSCIWGVAEDPIYKEIDMGTDRIFNSMFDMVIDHSPEWIEKSGIKKVDAEKQNYELFIITDPTKKETKKLHGLYVTMKEVEDIVLKYYKKIQIKGN